MNMRFRTNNNTWNGDARPQWRKFRSIFYPFIFLFLPVFCFSCSEDTNENAEFDNWQQRNDAYFASLKDSMAVGNNWKRIKKYSLDPMLKGEDTDYIYAKVLVEGTDIDGGCPNYTDSVRVSYQGRLIPTDTYPEGYVFDGTVYGSYNLSTTATTKFLISSNLVDGFATALQNMHRGDRWRVYIPYNLGYKATVQSSIPAYSTLIFDITLVDFSPVGKPMPVWK